jgi:hypothetical protein
MKPAQQLIALGAIGAAVVYFVRRPKILAQTAAGLATVLAALYFLGYLTPRHPVKLQAQTESPAQPAPVAPTPPPAPPQASAVNAAPAPHPTASPTSARTDDEAAKPAKRPPQPPTRSIATARDPALESWFVKSYLRCWAPPTALPPGEKYAAQIRVTHNADGSLMGGPVLVNPPSDPAWRAFADSAVRAVAKCNPLQVPARYASHFEQWKKLTLHFSPDSAT